MYLTPTERHRLKKKEWHLINKERLRLEKIERMKNPREFVRAMLRRAKNKSEWRDDLDFDISIEDVLIPEYCPIFPWLKLTCIWGNGFLDSNMSLDRIDPKLGYVKGNVQIVSYKANRNKNNSTLEELIALGEWATNVLNSKRKSLGSGH